MHNDLGIVVQQAYGENWADVKLTYPYMLSEPAMICRDQKVWVVSVQMLNFWDIDDCIIMLNRDESYCKWSRIHWY